MEASTCRNGEGTPESTALSLQEATSLSKGASSGEMTLLGQNNGAKENDHSTKPDDTKCAEPMSPVQLSAWRYDRQNMCVLFVTCYCYLELQPCHSSNVQQDMKRVPAMKLAFNR